MRHAPRVTAQIIRVVHSDFAFDLRRQ